MAQSLSQLYVHIIFHTKQQFCIHRTDTDGIHAYLGGLIKERESVPIKINGTENHVHIFCVLSKNMALSKFIQEIKAVSSKWIKTIDPYYLHFEWQKGYGAFSVSPSVKDSTIRYIETQQAHHKKYSFKEEYLIFLKEYGVAYNEEYLWDE